MDKMETNDETNNGTSIVALCLHGESLGFAVYEELYNSIIVDNVPSVSYSNLRDIIGHIKVIYNPKLFLLHPKLLNNTQLIELLQFNESQPDIKTDYQVPKSTLWNAELAIDLLTSKFILKDIRGSSEIKRNPKQVYKKIESLIDIQNNEILNSLSALLTHLQKFVFSLDRDEITLTSLKQSKYFDKFMKIDDSSFKSMQIFSLENHPNCLKENQRGKEDRTFSIIGRMKLKEWMYSPLIDKNLIVERQNSIEIFMKSCNRQFVSEIEKKLRHFHNIPRLLLRIKKVEATPSDWIKLITSIENGAMCLQHIIQFIEDINEEKDLSDKMYLQSLMAEVDVKTIQEIYYFLSDTFDYKQPPNHFGDKENNRLSIREGYDSHLDELRYRYECLDQYLVNAAHKILEFTPLLNTVRVEYIQQIGYLVFIHENDVQFIEHDKNFQFVFTDQTNYKTYKHPVVEELDNFFGDIKSMISDYQKAIILQIEEKLLELEYSLQLFSSMLATIDATISLSVISLEMKLVRPEIVEDNIIVIKNGRHPLQEMTVEAFVPNDTYISTEKPVSLITGPNSSGKSVYIKQVGIIVYMAHIGSFVPAEQAIVGLTDRIMTRISSVESVSTPQSAFSMDLTQVSKILNYSTSRSLILIDEFGKGTSPVDGIAILAATIKHMARLKFKALFTLHFTEIFENNILPDISKQNIYIFRMDILVNEKRSSDDDLNDLHESTPLFKLRVGQAPDSEGINCAKQCNVQEDIIERAIAIKKCIKSKKSLPKRNFRSLQQGIHNIKNKEILKEFLSFDWSSEEVSDHKTSQFLQAMKMKLL